MSETTAPAPTEQPVTPATPAKAPTLQERRAGLDAKSAPKAEEKPEAKPEEKPAEPKKPAAPDDLARLVAEDRRIKGEAKKIAAEREAFAAQVKEFEADRARILAAREAVKKGDRVGAIKAMFPDEDLTTDVVWDLLKAAGDKPDDDRVDPDKIAAMAVERFKAEQKAEQDRVAAEKAAKEQAESKELEEARGEYLSVVSNHYAANEANFPAMGRLAKQVGERRAGRMIGEMVLEAFEDHGKTNPGKLMSPSEALAAVEKHLRQDEKADAEPETKPAPTAPSAFRSDPGRPPAPPQRPMSLQDRRALLIRSDAR